MDDSPLQLELSAREGHHLGLGNARGRTDRAGLPAEVGVQARYKRLRVPHATKVNELSIKSMGFIDKIITCRRSRACRRWTACQRRPAEPADAGRRRSAGPAGNYQAK